MAEKLKGSKEKKSYGGTRYEQVKEREYFPTYALRRNEKRSQMSDERGLNQSVMRLNTNQP